MDEALCSILSNEKEWCFDHGRSITFNEDGTGQLSAQREHGFWILTNLEWKSVRSKDPVELPGKTAEMARRGPRLLGHVNLEIKLDKGMPEWTQKWDRLNGINEHYLTDQAFQPKVYTIRIERGNFIFPCSIGAENIDVPGATVPPLRYALRIIFDKSPYPPRSEWKTTEGGPDSYQFWNHTEFVARQSPELAKQGQAMNEIASAWTSCIVS